MNNAVQSRLVDKKPCWNKKATRVCQLAPAVGSVGTPERILITGSIVQKASALIYSIRYCSQSQSPIPKARKYNKIYKEKTREKAYIVFYCQSNTNRMCQMIGGAASDDQLRSMLEVCCSLFLNLYGYHKQHELLVRRCLFDHFDYLDQGGSVTFRYWQRSMFVPTNCSQFDDKNSSKLEHFIILWEIQSWKKI